MSSNDVRIVLVAKHGKNQDFENLLKEVFPSEIPVDMIDSIIIEIKDGSNAKLDHREIEELPTSLTTLVKNDTSILQCETN